MLYIWNTRDLRYQRLGLWCLIPLSIIIQLLRGDRFYWWRKPEYTMKSTDMTKVTDTYHIKSHRVHLPVVIDTDCTGSCKSNYNTIATTPSYMLRECAYIKTYIICHINVEINMRARSKRENKWITQRAHKRWFKNRSDLKIEMTLKFDVESTLKWRWN